MELQSDGTTGVSLAQAQTGPNIVPLGAENPSALDTEQEKFFDFQQSRIHLQRLLEDWHTEIEDTEVRRKTRDVEVDVEGLRQKGDLDEDETLVPVRTIDTNITREQPAYINYIKNSRRICTFRSLDNPQQPSQQIENEFSRGMTYCGWEKTIFKEIDGAETHGWAAIEVVYDDSKPLNVGLEYVAHDKLMFPRTCQDIQTAPRLCRAYDVSIIQLKNWVRNFGFDNQQVETLIQQRRDTQKEQETIRIYKLFFKKEDVVYVAWFALTDGLSDWLKAPVKLYLGIRYKGQSVAPNISPVMMQLLGQQQPADNWQDSNINLYPIFLLHYKETEKEKAVDHKGRCFLDENKQEAQTAILSGFINGLTRASNVYASPAQEDGTGSSLKEINDVKLLNGRIFSKPLNFWSIPYPDPLVIRALQYFDVANSEETNQVNFAAQNREDSRKTAREITAAQQSQQLINSVQLTLFSTHIREVYSFVWLIVQSQALQGKIKFLQIQQQQPQMNPLTNTAVLDQSGQPVTTTIWVNDVQTINQSWELRAAGDVDVIQRQETEQKMMQDWPVIQNTPLANEFLTDFVRLRYPDNGDRYAQVLASQPQVEEMKGIIGALGTIVEGMLKQEPKLMSDLDTNTQSKLTQIMTQIQPMLGKQQ